jgi:hypothetical protein
MTDQWNQQQPYDFESAAGQSGSGSVMDHRSHVFAPAITMAVMAALGIAWSLYGIVSSLLIGPQVAQMTRQMGEMTELLEQDMRRREQMRQVAGEGEGRGADSEPGGPPVFVPSPGPDIKGIMQLQSSWFQGLVKVGVAYSLLGAAFNSLILFGAISMMNLQRYVLAIISSVLVMLPLTSPCCLIGLPVGIWALVALTRPGVSEAFRGARIPAGI